MKHFYIMIIAIAVVSFSCHSNSGQAAQDTETQNMEENLPDGVYHFLFDDFEMWTLKDKSHNPMSMKLFSDADQSIVMDLVPSGEADASVNVFLIRRNGEYVLFDSGVGAANGGAMFKLLEALGVSPADIQAVCLTHFHFDHIGGMMTDGKASFPHAEIYFSAAEPQAWTEDVNVQAMLSAYRGHTHPFETDETILNGIVAKSAPGHTPGHTIYQVGNVLIVGDLLHAAAVQLPHPEFCARYDQDKPTAVKTRKAFYQYVEDNHLVVAGMHLPQSAVMKNFPIAEE